MEEAANSQREEGMLWAAGRATTGSEISVSRAGDPCGPEEGDGDPKVTQRPRCHAEEGMWVPL